MLFPQEEAPAVKQWLVRELEPLCDADPDVLADYVLALFKNDSNESELVAMLNEQLADFLEQHTQAFVSKTVEALKGREHVAGQTRKREDDDEGAPEEAMPTDEHASKRQAVTDDAMDEGEARDMPQARPRRNTRVPKGWCRDYHSTYAVVDLHQTRVFVRAGTPASFSIPTTVLWLPSQMRHSRCQACPLCRLSSPWDPMDRCRPSWRR